MIGLISMSEKSNSGRARRRYLDFRGRRVAISRRRDLPEFGGRSWWVEYEGVWFLVGPVGAARRKPDDRIVEWLTRNALSPEEEPLNDGRGPAWTTNESSPLVVECGGVVWGCWAQVIREEAAEPVTYWMVRGDGGERRGARVGCDDTISEIACLLLPAATANAE